MQTNSHCGYDAKISAAAAQCPEQVFIATVFGSDDAAICQNNVCSDQIVERKAEAADQRSITAAQCQPGQADGTA